MKSTSRDGFKDGSQSDSSLSEKRFSDGIPGIAVNSEEFSVDMFAPKCLCLVSRASYFDILKVALTFRNKEYFPYFLGICVETSSGSLGEGHIVVGK